MPLSLNKLERLLSTKGFIIKKYFTVKGFCVYVEVLSITNADSFLLYIPSKYEIQAEKGNNTYKVQYIELDEDGNIPGDYAGEPDNFDLEKAYDEVDIDLSQNDGHDLVDHLEENYNRPVSLKDITKDDKKDLCDVFRQLRRFRFCVQSIRYKLAIVFKNYLCCIRRDDALECFSIRNYSNRDNRKLMVSMDLETLYAKLDTVAVDVKTVRDGIYKVLDKNQLKHSRNLTHMLEQNNDITSYSNIVYIQKEQYVTYIMRLETMLAQLGDSEKKTVEKLMALDDRYSDPSLKGLHNDIERTHLTSKQEIELERINTVKQEIIRTIVVLKTKQENLMLKVDKIFFDNSVMLDAILKNMITLQSITHKT